MACGEVSVSGTPGRLFRISFSGERGYEIAVPSTYGESLFRLLVAELRAREFVTRLLVIDFVDDLLDPERVLRTPPLALGCHQVDLREFDALLVGKRLLAPGDHCARQFALAASQRGLLLLQFVGERGAVDLRQQITAAEKASAIAQLKALGVLVRQGV